MSQQRIVVLLLTLLVPFAGCSNPRAKLIGNWVQVSQSPGELRLELKSGGTFQITSTGSTTPPNIQQFYNKIRSGRWDLTKQGDRLVFEFDALSGSSAETYSWQLRGEGDNTFLDLTPPEGLATRTLSGRTFGISIGTYKRVN